MRRMYSRLNDMGVEPDEFIENGEFRVPERLKKWWSRLLDSERIEVYSVLYNCGLINEGMYAELYFGHR
jgi:hypothetical protein